MLKSVMTITSRKDNQKADVGVLLLFCPVYHFSRRVEVFQKFPLI
jgi:hypothetical protein